MSVPTEKEVVLCPLCHGHGMERKELLVVRWRSPEFEATLQNIADEAAFGTAAGMEDPFEAEHQHKVYNNDSD